MTKIWEKHKGYLPALKYVNLTTRSCFRSIRIEGAERIIRKEFHLTSPAVVQQAIDAYREQNDWMTEFLEECCELDPAGTIMSGELYQEYRAYCERMGEFARSTTDFYAELDKRDVVRKRTKKGVVAHGIRLRSVFES